MGLKNAQDLKNCIKEINLNMKIQEREFQMNKKEKVMVTIIKSNTVNPFTKKTVELFNYAYMLAKPSGDKTIFDCIVLDGFILKEEVDLFISKYTGKGAQCIKLVNSEFPWMSTKKFFSEIPCPTTLYGIRLSNMATERII